MASSKEYLNFILDQLAELADVSYKAMMGEYLIYYHSVLIGGIYDNRFLVKPVKPVIDLMNNPKFELPYEGAKEMLLIDDVDDKKTLNKIIVAAYNELSK